jgi:hypothetical protein
MTQHFPLDHGDVVHQGFFDPIQELLGASLPNLRIEVASSGTALQMVAGTGNSQQAAALNSSDGTKSGYRFITSTVTAAVPGTMSSGTATGSVYITASQNNFSGTTSAPDSPTTYSFGLTILASGTPTTDLWRKVGEVDTTSGSITAFRPMGGSRPTSEFGLAATPDTASQTGVLITGRSSQTGDLIRARNNSGTTVFGVSASGAITCTSTDGITVSGAGGKDTLNLSSTSSDTGITLGGDVTLYRGAANTLQTDDAVSIRRSSSTDTAIAGRLASGDSQDRIQILAGGEVQLGPGGSTAPDTRLKRSGTSTITIDTPSDGAANLAVTGNLTVGSSLTLSAATTTGHVPIVSNSSGLIGYGTIGTTSITDDAVTADKLRDDASTDGNRAVTTNHIRNGAVTAAKIEAATSETVGAPVGYSVSSGALTATKYADNLVTLGGMIVYSSWPGYFSSFTAFGETWTVLELGLLSSDYRPAQDQVTTGVGYLTSGNQVITTILILTTGEIAGRVSATGTSQPLRWGFSASYDAA